MNKTCPEELASPGATDPLCKLYEQLRSYMLGASDKLGQVYGLGVMLRQGMRAWIEATLESTQLNQASDHPISQKHHWIHSSVEAELTIMLATLVLKRSQMEV